MKDEVTPLTPLERALRRLEKTAHIADDQVRQLRDAIQTCRERGTLDERLVEREVLSLESRTIVTLQDINTLIGRMMAVAPMRRRGDHEP